GAELAELAEKKGSLVVNISLSERPAPRPATDARADRSTPRSPRGGRRPRAPPRRARRASSRARTLRPCRASRRSRFSRGDAESGGTRREARRASSDRARQTVRPSAVPVDRAQARAPRRRAGAARRRARRATATRTALP